MSQSSSFFKFDPFDPAKVVLFLLAVVRFACRLYKAFPLSAPPASAKEDPHIAAIEFLISMEDSAQTFQHAVETLDGDTTVPPPGLVDQVNSLPGELSWLWVDFYAEGGLDPTSTAHNTLERKFKRRIQLTGQAITSALDGQAA